MKKKLESFINTRVDRIIYINQENGYTVLELLTDDDSIVATGILPGIVKGEILDVYGTWKKHPSYGKQFCIEEFEQKVPENVPDILSYLSSGVVKNIRGKMAEKIVDLFGKESINIIEHEPEKLIKIKGISKNKAREISENFKNIFIFKEVFNYLSKFKILPKECVKAFNFYKKDTLKIIKNNPFCLCNEPVCSDFKKVDKIYLSLENNNLENKYRLRTGAIFYILKSIKDFGHTCLPREELEINLSFNLEVSKNNIKKTLDEMVLEGTLILENLNFKEFIFLPLVYNHEYNSAQKLIYMLKIPARKIENSEKYIKKIENSKNIKYAEKQKEAVKIALEKGMLILTGGPGTGKTTTLNAIIKILKNQGERVELAAPTGKAAQRMTELTGEKSNTVHRLLEATLVSDENKTEFRRNSERLLACDALILDELSMVDVTMFDAIMQALPIGCRLIMVGDTDQLPSIGSGNVLKDLINSGKIPVIKLNEIFRQSTQSLIVTNAHRIIHGRMPELEVKNRDFFFLNAREQEKIKTIILDLYTKRLVKAYNFSSISDIQILCPGRNTVLGTNELNKSLQQAINPSFENKKEIYINGCLFRENDKIIQTKNNYKIKFIRTDNERPLSDGILNGDIGTIKDINKLEKRIFINFEDKTAAYDLEDAQDLELAYALTVHKSQGSEFKAVIMPMFSGPPQLYYRNLLYTAITRAKKLLVLVGRQEVIFEMVNNNQNIERYSGLRYMLQE